MIPNNNLSVLPFYASIEEQNRNKWWAYGRTYPLYVPILHILPFQVIRPHSTRALTVFDLYKCDGTLVGHFIQNLLEAGVVIENKGDYDVIVFGGQTPVFTNILSGSYYAKLSDGVNTWYSDFFYEFDRPDSLLKLTWWDIDDLVMDAGTIVYKYANDTRFKNVLYLDSPIAKPTYDFTEEGEERNGYFFPIKQISKKVFHFDFLAPEYLLDVLRFVRMSDYVEIEKDGKRYSLDTFNLESEWQGDGDIASVSAEFTTATVAKKIGVGYIKAQRGDFNDDFNNDFDNE